MREWSDTRRFTWNEVEAVVKLIADRKWPDGHFSDDQCNLWSMIRRELNIDIP